MKLILLLLLSFIIVNNSYGFEKKSIIERYTNSSCGPCASINNSWYNQQTHDLIASNTVAHIVYNVNWPSAVDPMYLLNSGENAVRWLYYGVNAVPWIAVNGATITTSSGALSSAITSGNAEFAPFKIEMVPERFSNNVINVMVRIIRDPIDVNTYTKTKLKVGLTERAVQFPSPLGNGESIFYSITRKMLPDAKGTEFTIPAPGDTTIVDLSFVPSANWLSAVILDSIRVVGFIQNDGTKQIYQSTMENLVSSNRLNAAFVVDQKLGTAPMAVSFQDYSTGTNGAAITSWKWDFDNDGTFDSQIQNPSHTYAENGIYTVSLTVGDGISEFKRTYPNLVHSLGSTADILVVNGIDYVTYAAEMTSFYTTGAAFGENDVDVWDLFGDQGFDYSVNSNILQTDLYTDKIPLSIMKLYKKIIWIGNNYGGDANYYDADRVLEYVQGGGNFMLAARMGSFFFNQALRDYCGIITLTGDMTLTQLNSLDSGLVNVPAVGTNSLVHFVFLDTSTTATPIFDEDTTTQFIAGFRIQKEDEGGFVFVAGRPYRMDNTALKANSEYILANYLNYTPPPTGIKDPSDVLPSAFELSQNYPNPFNPATTISYALPYDGNVRLTLYNSLGEVVKVLTNDVKQAGTHKVVLNASNLSSGIYFYSIQVTSNDGSYFNTKKLILMK